MAYSKRWNVIITIFSHIVLLLWIFLAFDVLLAYQFQLQQSQSKPAGTEAQLEGLVHTLADALRESGRSSTTNNQGCMRQLMARQTVGSKLPAFSRLLEEWPIFIHLFQSTNHECGYSPSENLLRLQRTLKGKAKEVVAALLTLLENVPAVLQTLETRFGRADLVIATLINKAKVTSVIRTDDFEALVNFSTAVQTLVSTMKLMTADGHVFNPQIRQELVSKLPASLRLQWGRPSNTMYRTTSV